MRHKINNLDVEKISVLQIAQTIKQKAKMKKSFLRVMILALATGAFSASAQYDDIYYSSGAARSRPKPVSNQADYYGNERYDDQEAYYEEDYDAYDDEAYNYLDEYDYSYTHRIRRFHRPLIGRGFYDPFYWDPWYFDPFYYSRGFGFITPRIGIGFFSFYDFNRWNRWQRFNSYRYWDPWAFSYWSYDPFLFNRYNNFYWAGNAWCPTSWYSNNYYINNNFWGNRYNGTYQPRYYTDNNSFFGPRRYGTTTTGDRGPSRSSTRIFSEPTGNSTGQPLRRTTPRDVETTVVRERNVPISRNQPKAAEGSSDRISPRGNNESSRATQTEKPRSFRDFDNNTQDNNQRNAPRFNDPSNQERNRNMESPRRNEPISTPQSPRSDGNNGSGSSRSGSVSPRNNDGLQSRQMDMAPRNHPYLETPSGSTRMRLPERETPSYSAPRTNGNSNNSIFRGSGNSGSSGNRTFNTPSRSGNSGFSGSSPSSGGSRSSGGSAPQSSGGGRTSPRNQ